MWWLPARRFLHPASLSNSARLMSSSTSTHSSSTAGGALTPALLKSLTSFWLGDHPNGPLKEPMDMSRFKRWFSSSPENDRLCQERFGPAVEEASHKTDQQLLDLATGEDSPEAALGLALLLDQIPRNIYRGAEARKAYEECDPKAQTLVKALINDPYNYDQRSEVGNWPRKLWFYMPLMHSENLKDHDLFRAKVAYWMSHPVTAEHEEERKVIQINFKFEEDHRKVIEEFGRYYSRNDALGRECTPQELEALKNGPGWGQSESKE